MPFCRPAITLSLDSKGFHKLGDSLFLKAFPPVPGEEGERTTLRYDGPQFQLAALGVGLAVSSQGEKGAKRQIVSAETVRFGRWESPLASDGPDIALLESLCPGLDAGAFDLAVVASESLNVRTYQAGEARICLECGESATQSGLAPLFRVVISGPVRSWSRLLRLARLIGQTAACDLLQSEGEPSLILAQGLAGCARKSRRLILQKKETPGLALRRIARMGLEQIAANRPLVMSQGEETIEGVHQMRVGVRRLRSALSLFRPLLTPEDSQRVLSELKELGSRLGPMRDRDVFLGAILGPVRLLAPEHEGLEALEEQLSAERGGMLEQARQALEPGRFASFTLDLLEWSENGTTSAKGDLVDFANAALDKRHSKLMKSGRDFERLDALKRHALRIRGKKMRYAGEFLQSLYPGAKTKRYLESLTGLVDVLGHLNDIAVARRVLEERRETSADTALHHGIGFAEGWHAGRAGLLEEQALAAWEDFRRQEKFWR
ncbi:MAG: CHAD domain-containing protein [Alphaproteobacteria bacterium]|nr:CHAD domain-containing protein [Alphaproteobacteria bacterium]